MTISRSCSADGPEDAQILVLTDRPAWADLADGRFLSDHSGRIFWDSMRSSGLLRSQMRTEAICPDDIQNRAYYEISLEDRTRYESQTLERLARTKPNLILALGDWPLEFLTGHKSSDKYHLSLLPQLDPAKPKVLSLLHPERVFREHKSAFYLRLGADRARREALSPNIVRSARNALVRPNAHEALSYLRRVEKANWLSVDIETSYGHITCIGFGSSPHEAVCIPTLPDQWTSHDEWFAIWKQIGRTLGGPSKKVFQNGIYDLTYLASYGIRVENFFHDTMIAQRILHPEFSVGLDNINRIYVGDTYWKDEAKDWSSRIDPEALWRYNAKDVCITLAAAWAQRVDLERRGLLKYFDYTMRLARGPVLEMSWRGLPFDVAERDRLALEAEKRVAELEFALNEESQKFLSRPTNPRSPAQVKELLYAAGFKRLPFKGGKETSDKGALMKLRLKQPSSKLLTSLIDISEVQKELSSYLRVEYDAKRSVIPFTLYAAGTETMRFSCGKDPWNRGLNAQTIPSHLKSMFKAPEGSSFVEIDLAQADARVVAWDSAEPTLISFFQTKRDIHRYVASQPELFNCSPDAITHDQRQLGKKVGHAANYGVGPATLVESALKEMNLQLSEQKAARMLQGYYRTFPGILRWHERIREQISRTRKLVFPTGYSRSFNDRFGPDMLKEAYAALPQHLVAYAINQLVLKLFEHFPLLLQIHDSCLVLVEDSELDSLLASIKNQSSWNPTYKLSGGDLRIPIEVKSGRIWSSMTRLYEG